jgi:ABC-2 type transport system permease protein
MPKKSLERLLALLWKEFIQVLRDWRTLAMTLSLPLIELLLFALAVHMTVDHIPLAVFDQSRDAQSRDLVAALANSGYFNPQVFPNDQKGLQQAIDYGTARAGLIIPPDFAARLRRGDAEVLILIDGSDSFSVQAGYGAASSIAQQFALQLAAQRLQAAGGSAGGSALPITLLPRVLYNPSSEDLVFILPGLIGVVMQLLAIGSAALAVVREREAGTLEQLLTTPIRPLELMIAKLIPNLVIILLDIFLTTAVGVFYFKVPFQGSLWLFFWMTVLFAASSLGLGLLISTIAQTQRQAQQFSNLFTLFSMLLTGFLYPMSAMPAIPRFIGSLLPLSYFMRLMRGIITKGVGLQFLWQDALVLSVYAVSILLLASLTFRKRLD